MQIYYNVLKIDKFLTRKNTKQNKQKSKTITKADN